MKSYLLFLTVIFLSVFANAGTESGAKKLLSQFFTEPALTDAYISGFTENRSEQMMKFYKAHSADIRQLIKSNYTEPLLQEAYTTVSVHLQDAEITQILNFFATPTGAKAKEILKKKPAQKVTEILTKEELATIDNFYKSYAGLMWDAALRKIVAKMKDPNSKLAVKTKNKLADYFKANSIAMK